MKKKNKENELILDLFLICLFIGTLLYGFIYFGEKIDCDFYKKEGINTRMSFSNMCEIQLKTQDNKTFWIRNMNKISEFEILNYGVKIDK